MAGIPRTKLVKDAQLIDRAQIGDSLHARTHAPATLIPFFLAFICLVDTPVDGHASCQFAFFCYEETAPICILRPLAISHYFAPLVANTYLCGCQMPQTTPSTDLDGFHLHLHVLFAPYCACICNYKLVALTSTAN